MPLIFKQCTHSDLEILVKVSKETFIVAFEKDNDPEDFKNYIEKAFSYAQLQNELENPDTFFYFAFDEQQLVGYFKLNIGESQTDVYDELSLEIERIYVREPFQGKKFGSQMLGEIQKLTKEKNKAFIWLGVWEHNLSAIRFYQRHGFQKFGEHPYYIGTDKQTDWLLRLEL
ncbi:MULTISPECIES: GNAT family N-acetyltransferase [Flavobacteriaceae]|uniref:GNAT family N-acetyltransferase n=1 Tax=Flavobacteriaceae TaxID=49546 RepID=UPI001490CEA0|nr:MULTISPECIES: GNAT family N-acetyltransferase [Allomuricauda]MDC6366421.1 GNAT family N-acetyltransferase [Muricauda sp. AC10]